jgi:hypothetical protein
MSTTTPAEAGEVAARLERLDIKEPSTPAAPAGDEGAEPSPASDAPTIAPRCAPAPRDCPLRHAYPAP